MQGKSGFEICQILKSQNKTMKIPVIMFTVLGRNTDRTLSANAGADGHFLKPFTPKDLLVEVKKYLDETKLDKFSKQLGLKHNQLIGKKILFEFDPSIEYGKFVRDIAIECVSNKENIVLLTKKGTVIQQILDNEKGVVQIDLNLQTLLSPILKDHPTGSFNLIFNSLTDLILSTDFKATYNFIQATLGFLVDPRITSFFLFNPSAHDSNIVSCVRGLFINKIGIEKKGIACRIA